MAERWLALIFLTLTYQKTCSTKTFMAKSRTTTHDITSESPASLQNRFIGNQDLTREAQEVAEHKISTLFETEDIYPTETEKLPLKEQTGTQDSSIARDTHSGENINFTTVTGRHGVERRHRVRSRSGETANMPSTQPYLETDELRPQPMSAPMTNEELYSLVEGRGYHVMNFSDGSSPLLFMGDTAYYPQQVLTDLPFADQRSNIYSKRLWIDGRGRQQVYYYYDTSTQADQKVFEAAVATWAQSTCIRFYRLPPGRCNEDRGVGAVCVGNFGGCWSFVGNNYGVYGWERVSQKMSVEPNGCELAAAAHEFGHALGLGHQQARPDRSQYMHINYHNLDIKLDGDLDKQVKKRWDQAQQCNLDQTVEVPTPYDYLSLMQYAASSFAMEDGRIVYATRDAHHQYMTNYHRDAGLMQTHYDKLVVNTAYQCTALWRRSCAYYGLEPPKCLNGGYTDQRCRCLCPDGYSGTACQSRTGPLYPLQDRAKTVLDISRPGVYSLARNGMHLENHGYAKPQFVFFQYLTVAIDSGDDRVSVRVRVHQPFDAVRTLADPFNQQYILSQLGILDCMFGMRLYWGDWGANRIRTECFSSLVTNEPSFEHPWLRSRGRRLEMVAMSQLGKYFGDARITKAALELTLNVTFEINKQLLRTFELPADDPGDLEQPSLTGRAARLPKDP